MEQAEHYISLQLRHEAEVRARNVLAAAPLCRESRVTACGERRHRGLSPGALRHSRLGKRRAWDDHRKSTGEVGEKVREPVGLESQGGRCFEKEGILNGENRGAFISSLSSLARSQLLHRIHCCSTSPFHQKTPNLLFWGLNENSSM